MTAVLKRELGAYFHSAIGFTFLAVFYLCSGMFFYFMTYSRVANMSVIFSNMFTIIMLIIPILTLKLMSDDKRLKTDQALLTAPVRLSSLVIGKYLSALIVYVLALAVNVVYMLVLGAFTEMDWMSFWGNLLGMFLLGAAVIAIGLFISSLTNSQAVAAIGTLAASMLIILMDSLASAVSWGWLTTFIGWISFNSRYEPFTSGILNYSNVFFFISVVAIFLFLTMRVLDKKRWS